MPAGGKGGNKQWEGSKICIMKPIFSVRTLELLGLIVSTGSFDVFACFGFHHILPLLSAILETGVSEWPVCV